jgi:hypothetical protein
MKGTVRASRRQPSLFEETPQNVTVTVETPSELMQVLAALLLEAIGLREHGEGDDESEGHA